MHKIGRPTLLSEPLSPSPAGRLFTVSAETSSVATSVRKNRYASDGRVSCLPPEVTGDPSRDTVEDAQSNLLHHSISSPQYVGFRRPRPWTLAGAFRRWQCQKSSTWLLPGFQVHTTAFAFSSPQALSPASRSLCAARITNMEVLGTATSRSGCEGGYARHCSSFSQKLQR